MKEPGAQHTPLTPQGMESSAKGCSLERGRVGGLPGKGASPCGGLCFPHGCFASPEEWGERLRPLGAEGQSRLVPPMGVSLGTCAYPLGIGVPSVSSGDRAVSRGRVAPQRRLGQAGLAERPPCRQSRL